MKKRFLTFAMLTSLALIVAITACKNESNGDDNSGETTEATQPIASTAPKTDTVIIQSMTFTPQNLTINQGDTVLWINKGIVGHNITVKGQENSLSGDFQPGQSWSMVPDSSFDYFCNIHPTMTASITIQ